VQNVSTLLKFKRYEEISENKLLVEVIFKAQAVRMFLRASVFRLCKPAIKRTGLQ
jgi:hypothetical protein